MWAMTRHGFARGSNLPEKRAWGRPPIPYLASWATAEVLHFVSPTKVELSLHRFPGVFQQLNGWSRRGPVSRCCGHSLSCAELFQYPSKDCQKRLPTGPRPAPGKRSGRPTPGRRSGGLAPGDEVRGFRRKTESGVSAARRNEGPARGCDVSRPRYAEECRAIAATRQ